MWKIFDDGRAVSDGVLQLGISRVRGRPVLFLLHMRHPLCTGKTIPWIRFVFPSREFLLCSLRGRLGSGRPSPYRCQKKPSLRAEATRLSGDIPLCTGETAAAPGGAALRKRYPSACGKNRPSPAGTSKSGAISLCMWEKPFHGCGSFSRHKGSRFSDRRPA